MAHREDTYRPDGFTLAELVVTMGVLAICLAVGLASSITCLQRTEARGTAQAWQAAAAWAQTGVLWHGGGTTLCLDSDSLSLLHDAQRCGGRLQGAAPAVAVSTNVPRWLDGDGVEVRYVGELASPDSGGSLYFNWATGSYRVVIRPVSGLTARSLQGP